MASNLIIKLKLIFLPFLYYFLGFLVGYSLLTWLLVYQYEIIRPNEELLQLWIPGAGATLFVLIYLRPRIKLLKLGGTSGDKNTFGYCFVGISALAVPCIVAQTYLGSASGTLTTLNNISELHQHKLSKYYRFKQFYADKADAVSHIKVYTTGKYSETLVFEVFVATPIIQDSMHRSANVVAWLGWEYGDKVSSNASQSEKEGAYKAFLDMANIKYKSENFKDFDYLDRIRNNDYYKGFVKAIQEKGINATSAIILIPKVGNFDDRAGRGLFWSLVSPVLSLGAWLVMVLIPKIDNKKLKKYLNPPAGKRYFKWWSFFYNKGVRVTPILILVNVVVYLIMVLSGLGVMSFAGDDLVNWGGSSRDLVLNGQWWRLFTSTFVHGGLGHVVMNMFGLFMGGAFLEYVLKPGRLLIVYLGCGVAASIVSICWHEHTLSVGASGAIMGLFGAQMALCLTKRMGDGSRSQMVLPIIFAGSTLLYGLAGAVDNAAHIGGLITGFVMGLLFSIKMEKIKPKPTRKRKKAAAKTEASSEVAEKDVQSNITEEQL